MYVFCVLIESCKQIQIRNGIHGVSGISNSTAETEDDAGAAETRENTPETGGETAGAEME